MFIDSNANVRDTRTFCRGAGSGALHCQHGLVEVREEGGLRSIVQGCQRFPGISGFVVGFGVRADITVNISVSEISLPVDGEGLDLAAPMRPANEGVR